VKKLILILFILSISKANAEQYFWKCYDYMLMSTSTNQIQTVKRKQFKSANVYVDTKEKTLKKLDCFYLLGICCIASLTD
jgi:hypothetical protein